MAGFEPGRPHRRRRRRWIVVPCFMTGRQNARIKASVGAPFYPCCALCLSLGSAGSVQGSVGSRQESGMSFSRANTLDTGGRVRTGTSTSEASEALDRRSLLHDT